MQTFPKLFITQNQAFSGNTLLAAPDAETYIRLYNIDISIPKNTTVPISGSVGIGIKYTLASGVLNIIHKNIFLPSVSVTTDPGNIEIHLPLGTLGVLCYTAIPGVILSSVTSYITQTLGTSLASWTMSYNLESL